MSAACMTCAFWLTQRVTDYANGERIVNYQAPDGKGMCEVLKVETFMDFGCIKHAEGGNLHIEVIGTKSGSPWMHSRWGGCPECGGTAPDDEGNFKMGSGQRVAGSIGCDRCQTTGRVLYYDDGYVGEEKTRRHPNEATLGPPPEPKCLKCGAVVELKWMACPHCGQKVEKPTVERVEGFIGDNTNRDTMPITVNAIEDLLHMRSQTENPT